MSHRNSTTIIKKIEQMIRKTGFDENFTNAIKYHLEVLRDSNEEADIETEEEMLNYLFSKMFIDKVELYPTQHFKCEVDENSDWPVKPIPSDFFGEDKQDDSERKKWFYASLNVYDILDCRVSALLPAAGYHLRIIHKYGVTRLLDDLQLMVIFCPVKEEKQLLGKELLMCELVRVAVFKIEKLEEETKIYGTINPENIVCCSTLPKLGRITEEDLPAYVLEPIETENFTSYSDYLNSKPQFLNPHFYEDIFCGFGISSRRVCSYYPEINGKKHPDEKNRRVLLKESKVDDAKHLAHNALKCLQRGMYDEGHNIIATALKLCPEKDQLISKLYEIRSDLYFAQAGPTNKNKGICDLEKALKLKPGDDLIKKKMITNLFKTSSGYYKEKKYKEALHGFKTILKYDKNNSTAAKTIAYIKAKHANQLVNLEERSLLDLQEKKKEIISELKKINL